MAYNCTAHALNRCIACVPGEQCFRGSDQVVEDGYEFFAQRQLVTVFSAPNYCGEFDNAGAIMAVDQNLCCSFHVLQPRDLQEVQEERQKALLDSMAAKASK
eukprot:COSAG05_NODE_2647_length_2806_cov_3.529368_2_plen_102_part_00